MVFRSHTATPLGGTVRELLNMEYSPLAMFKQQEWEKQVGIVVLNSGRDLRGLQNVLMSCWTEFKVRVCADGGANTLFDSLTDADRDRYLPDAVVGDLDSIRPNVKDYYQNKGVSIVRVSDQDTTDFQKCIEYCRQSNVSELLVVNTLFGRMDQVLANINALYIYKDIVIFLLMEDSIMFVVQPGSHVIHVGSGLEEGHCGLVPLGGKCTSCSTTGLQWNLDNHCMELGAMISTNNLLTGDSVTIDCSTPLLFTMSHNLLLLHNGHT